MPQPNYLFDAGHNKREGFTKPETNDEIVNALFLAEYETLETDNKTIGGAINELKNKFGNYYTKQEIDDMIKNIYPINTAAGAVANFKTSLNYPLQSLTANIKATQASGTPTPNNVLPIYGTNTISLFKRGCNLFNIATKEDNKAIVWSSGATFSDNKSIVSDFIEVKEGITYSSNYNVQWCCYDKNKNYLGNILQGTLITSSGSDRENNTIPLGFGIYYVRLGIRTSLNGNQDITQKTDIVFCVGATAQAYEPYNGATITISLGGTYYGGYLTQNVTGQRFLVLTHKMLEWSDLNFRRSNNSGNWTNYLFFAGVSDMKYNYLQKSDIYEIQTTGNIGNIENYKFRTALSGAVTYVYFRNDDYGDVEEFKTAMNDHQFLYEITEPIIISMTDGEVLYPLNGINNIFADSGDVSVDFKQDVANYVQSLIGG